MKLIVNRAMNASVPSKIALLLLLTLFTCLYLQAWHLTAKHDLAAFQTFYPAARAMHYGRDPYEATSGRFAYVYPPFYAFVLQPLTFFPKVTAAHIMLAVNGLCILAAFLICSRTMLLGLGPMVDAANAPCIALLAALIAVVPIYNELRGLETNSIILLSFVLGLYWVDRRPVRAGFALAIAICIKYLPIILLPYLFWRRKYAAAAATVVWSIVLSLAPATTLGWSTTLKYIHFALGGLLHLAGVQPAGPVASVHATDIETSLSITSAVARWVAATGGPRALGSALVAVIAGVWLLCLLVIERRERRAITSQEDSSGSEDTSQNFRLVIEWAALVTFAIAFSPNTQNRNLVLAVVPATLAAALALFAPAPRARLLASVISGLLFIALLLPIAMMGKPFTVFWVKNAGACWVLLIAYVALTHAAQSREYSPQRR